jgi:hypothetical protein
MKTRFLRIIWVSSVLWLGLILFGGLFGTAKDELVLNLIVFGWPAILGLLICYFVGGSFWWPEEPNNESDSAPARPLRTIDLEPQSKASTDTASEERFLKTLDKSRQSVLESLANEQQKMLDDWNTRFGDELEKLEQAKLTIRASEVIEALLEIVNKTESWNTCIDYEPKGELIPEWIASRLFYIDTTQKQSLEFSNFNQHKPDGIEKEIGTLEDCLGLKIDDLVLQYFVYKLSEDSSYTKHGRAQLFVNSDCVLEISLRQPVGQFHWNWGYEIFIAAPGSWMSSILNLNEEFKGRAYIEEQTIRLKEKEFLLKQSNPQASGN